jgi:hypothetical protein
MTTAQISEAQLQNIKFKIQSVLGIKFQLIEESDSLTQLYVARLNQNGTTLARVYWTYDNNFNKTFKISYLNGVKRVIKDIQKGYCK